MLTYHFWICWSKFGFAMYCLPNGELLSQCVFTCLYMFICVVSPDAIHMHVKTKQEVMKGLHYFAPEYKGFGHSSFSSSLSLFPYLPLYISSSCLHACSCLSLSSPFLCPSSSPSHFFAFLVGSLPHPSSLSLAEGPITTPADIYSFGVCALEVKRIRDLLGGPWGLWPRELSCMPSIFWLACTQSNRGCVRSRKCM